MHNFLNGYKDGYEISIDPNKIQINKSGTNMKVATYSERDLNRGDNEPKFINFKTLDLRPEAFEILNGIFKIEQSKLKGIKKVHETAIRAEKNKQLVC